MKYKFWLPILFFTFLVAKTPYFQQHVAYEIQVILNDSAHTLNAHEVLTYTNHSPDTLDFLWFHLWPNAYKNDETALAKQKLQLGSTRFHFSKEKDRGYIDSLDFSVSGHSVEWEFHPEWIDVAKVFLPEPLIPDGSVTIETPFFVKLPKVFSRLGHSGKHYEITQWYPKPAVYDRDGWHHMPYLDMGEFYSEFGTFDVFITLPENYRIMATGDLVNGEKEYAWLDSLAQEGDALHSLGKKAFKKKIKKLKKAGKKWSFIKWEKDSATDAEAKTLHFHQENVHDFAWFADPNWIVRKGELWLADSSRSVTLWSMYLPKNAKMWANSIEYLHDSGYWYSQFYGDYPYNHITAVDGDLSASGGMEYPNITVISVFPSKDVLEFVIMHEVGHNWFYGILGSNERDHAWLDEGLNEYTNVRYWEKKYPERQRAIEIFEFVQKKMKIAPNLRMDWVIGYMNYVERANQADDQPIDLTSTEFHRSNYGTCVYGKTGIFTRYLQHYLGEEKMNEIMQDYYETWKFKHPQPADFRSFFEKHTDKNLGWYFDDAINDTKVIDYSLTLNANQLQVANQGTMRPPLEIAFYDQNENEIKRQWIDGFDGTVRIDSPPGTVSAKIDPDNYLPDIDQTNNSVRRPLKLHFVFDQPDYSKREVYWVPWLFNWNRYNGWTPGILFYSGYIPTYRFGLSFNPMWDFNNNRLIGSLGDRRNCIESSVSVL